MVPPPQPGSTWGPLSNLAWRLSSTLDSQVQAAGPPPLLLLSPSSSTLLLPSSTTVHQVQALGLKYVGGRSLDTAELATHQARLHRRLHTLEGPEVVEDRGWRTL